MCQDTYETIGIKLGMMLNTTKLYSLNDLDGHSRSHGDEKARTCAVISVVKLHEATQMFLMDDYVRKITVKKFCKYGKYESF